MQNRVTLRDIAAAAGVHYSTISLALRDNPRISQSVRQKIKEIAEQMGYIPDPALSALNAYRKTKLPAHYQSTIAWVDNWKGMGSLRDQPTFNEYFEGAYDRVRQLGYELEEFQIDVSPERASKILRTRGIKGLLLAPQFEARTQLPFHYDWFSSITFGYSLQPRVFHLVTNHQLHSVISSMQELTKLGYRKIGLFLHKDIDDKVDNAYVMGYWHFCHEQSLATYMEPRLIPRGESDRSAFFEWYQTHKPDAVLSSGRLSIVDWFKEIGLSVPDDVGYARLSVGRNDEYHSGVYENGLLIGRTAVDFLVGMLQRGEYGFPDTPIRILVEGVWKPGKTVRQIRPPAN
jgi:LacI family transcriptional regulator